MEGLIEASERRQQRELAFRLAQAMQDVDTQRRSDLVRIENGLGQIEGLTVQEVARQSRLINYLMRTSQENGRSAEDAWAAVPKCRRDVWGDGRW